MKNQERTPLRTILLNFLNHIENLEEDINDNSYETEFQELKIFSETLKSLKQYSCSEGEKEVNKKKNRYKDILPFDLSRVILNEYAGIPGSDYINANYIKGASGSPAYIASQGPLPHTVNDFWRMVVQCEVQVIVMACNEEEAGKHKCENYWVEGEGEEKQFGMVTIRLVKASTVCPDFSVRTMRLKYTNTQANTEERTVCQFHYSAWPDHGVPPLVRPLLDMVRLVRDTQASETLPVLVHCSAGCGRTGTICAIDYVWGLLRAGKLTKDFSLLSLVREMRRQRIAMVQTKEQYVLVHQAVRELFKEQLRMIDSHPYENIDCNGMPIDTEPTYAAIENKQNIEEKKDNKEKDTVSVAPAPAPPLPVKKKFPVVSSKHEKEVENLSEKQRIAEQAGSTFNTTEVNNRGGHRPKITKLRSLFEKEMKQVSRSQSLGTPLKANVFFSDLKVSDVAKPSSSTTVKRSKSLRVLGSSDRSKLSLHSDQSFDLDERNRRLSLESNVDVEHQDYPLSPTVNSIVAGLGTRERRNSFREAINRTGKHETVQGSPAVRALVRSYTAIDIQLSNRERTDTLKPALRPKPLVVSRPSQQQQKPISARPITKSDVTWHAARSDTRPKATQAMKQRITGQSDNQSRTPTRDKSTTFSASSSNMQHSSYQSAKVPSKSLPNTPRPTENFNPGHHPVLASKSNVAEATPILPHKLAPFRQRALLRHHTQGPPSRPPAPMQPDEPQSSASAQNQLLNHNQTPHSSSTFDSTTSMISRTDPQPRFKNGSPHSRFTNTDSQFRLPSTEVHQAYYAVKGEPGMGSNETPTRPVPAYHQQRQLFRDKRITQFDDIRSDRQKLKVDEITQDIQNNRITPHSNTNSVNTRLYPTETVAKPVSSNDETEYYGNYALSERRQMSRQPQSAIASTSHVDRRMHLPLPQQNSPQSQAANEFDSPAAGATVTNVNYGVKLRRGSRDDLALCSGAALNKVKRHASVVVLRNSLIETSQGQLSVCNPTKLNGDTRTKTQLHKKESEDPWSGAVGVDLDEVAANMTSQKDGSSSKLMKAALQALHRRKGVPVPTLDPVNEPIYSPAPALNIPFECSNAPPQQIQNKQIQQKLHHQQVHQQVQMQKHQQQVQQQMHQQQIHQQMHQKQVQQQMHHQQIQQQMHQKQVQQHMQQQQQVQRQMSQQQQVQQQTNPQQIQQQQAQAQQHQQTVFRKQQHYL